MINPMADPGSRPSNKDGGGGKGGAGVVIQTLR